VNHRREAEMKKPPYEEFHFQISVIIRAQFDSANVQDPFRFACSQHRMPVTNNVVNPQTKSHRV